VKSPESPLEQSRRARIREIAPSRPFAWLALGWRDLALSPAPALLTGVALALFGAVLLYGARDEFWWLAGAFSGFLIVAPVLATGLYAVSRARSRGERAGVGASLVVWRPRDGRLVAFGLLLALAGTGWVLTSASLITGFAAAPVRNPAEFLRFVVLREDSLLFEAWLALGGVLAAPMFASSVIAMPMLLDRRVGVWAAVLTSWRAVATNPVPLALWAALIGGLTLLGMATAMLGLVVIVPLLGHASWHAYVDLVDASALPACD
jgi:uncharacterized membrane protein